jgi:cytochrome c-type biogenesis protein CcmH/NrfG
VSSQTPAEQAPSATRHRLSRRWSLGAVTLILALVLSGVLWYCGALTPGPRVPEVNLAGIDPEVAGAIREARTTVAQQPGSARAWGELANKLHATRFSTQALACYAEAERLDPRNGDWPYLRALILRTTSAPADAIPFLQRAIECDRNAPLPRLRLGEILLEQGQGVEASVQFRAVLALDGAEPRARLRLAQMEAARGDWSACLRHLEASADSPSARKQVCALRLRAYEALGDNNAAGAQQRLLATLPDDPPWPDAVADRALSFPFGLKVRLQLAMAYLHDLAVGESVALLEDTVRKYPDSAAAWDKLGQVRGTLGQFPQAEQALRRSLDLDPNGGDVWYFLGLMRLQQSKFDEALEAFHAAARLKPTDALVHCKIGECLLGKGERAAAAAAYHEALRYQPGLAEAQAALARLGRRSE